MAAHSVSSTSGEYETLRQRYFNGRVPDIKPAEIALPTTTFEVKAAVERARANSWKVGVRSGGHLFFCNSLLEGGLLIDTKNLNKHAEYDTRTKIACVSPGHTVQDVATFLESRGRFFPSGHSRDVGIGGFLLAGGQGLFLRGWGYTATSWVTQIEVVTSDGDIVLASKTQNSDLFWAAPGSGQGFFGVVTRIWVRTIPAKRLFDTTTIIDSTDMFKPLMKWVLDTSKKVPKYGVDLFFCTFYADKDEPGDSDESTSKRVFFVINATMFADSIDEAKTMASPFDVIPDEFKNRIVTTVPMLERSREELWQLQESFQPSGNGESWGVDSILVDPKATDDEVIDTLTPALYDLPSRLSSGTFCPIDFYPDEEDQALSLPQKAYASTMMCWKDPQRDAFMDKWLLDAYTKADAVSVGVYVADFNINHRMTKVMTDTALKKWLRIRNRWDPSETFVGHRGFSSILKDESHL